jgi:hypothetical protein
MLTSEARAPVMEIQDRLIDLYVQQVCAAGRGAVGNRIRTGRASCKSRSIRPRPGGKRSGAGRLRE